ncbi:MAG: permease-like cell division protein FtsX [Candidatus Paceibacterota bacterium]
MSKMQDALVAIRRTPYQSTVAILMVTITFFVAYMFSLFAAGTNAVLQFFETRPQVIAFFNIDAQSSQVESLASTMQDRSYVEKVNIISKEQALEIYRNDHREDPLLLELVTADILPASVEVSGRTADSLVQIQTDLSGAPGVEDVVYQEDIVKNIRQWTDVVRISGFVATGTLGIVSFLSIVTLVGMKVSAKRHTIGVMNIIGATNWYISGPFVLEGMLYGVIGSLVGWIVMYALLLYATPWIEEFMGGVMSMPLPWQIFVWQLGAGTLSAIILGAGASLLAVRRMLKRS